MLLQLSTMILTECNILILGKSHNIPPAALLHCHALWHTSAPAHTHKKDEKNGERREGINLGKERFYTSCLLMLWHTLISFLSVLACLAFGGMWHHAGSLVRPGSGCRERKWDHVSNEIWKAMHARLCVEEEEFAC